MTAQIRESVPPAIPVGSDTLISIPDLKLLVHRLSGYQIQIGDDDPLLTTVYINRAVLGAALHRAETLQNAVKRQIASLPGAADLEMKRAAGEAVAGLTAEVGKIANRIAGNVAAAERNKAFYGAVVASVVGAVACVAIGFGAGVGWNKLVIANIKKNAQDRIERAENDTAWMQTPSGKAAKNLADMNVGNLNMAVMLNDCSVGGWKKERKGVLGQGATYCFPYSDKENVTTGWKIKD
ncbi:MAG TPA: DUF6753 family protein [Noviherbaspirillum sp.]|nr:DUF6753 family protein [Noviherbaspirillum sp.]